MMHGTINIKHFKCNFSEEHVAHLRQKCHNSKCVIFQEKLLKVLKRCTFSMSATTTLLLSSGEFCKLRYDTIPVKECILKRFLPDQ